MKPGSRPEARSSSAILALTIAASGALHAQAPGDVLDQVRHGRDPGGYLFSLLDFQEQVGSALAAVGDRNGDGVPDLAVGVPGQGPSGEVWIVHLAADGSILSHVPIGAGLGGFDGGLQFAAGFGSSLAAIGDLDGDGVEDLAVGAPFADFTAGRHGELWILFLNADGTVRDETRITEGAGGFGGALADNDAFGASVAALGDLDGDGVVDLAVGAIGDDDGGNGRGAVWLLGLDPTGAVLRHRKISQTSGAGFGGTLRDSGRFGQAVEALGDFDGDGVFDLVVGAPGFGNSSIPGEVWGLLLRPDGSVKGEARICADFGPCADPGGVAGNFGWAIRALGDLDGNGATDLLVGEPNANTGDPFNVGALWTLLLEPDGSVRYANRFEQPQGGSSTPLLQPPHFGAALAILDTPPDDGLLRLAVGSPGDDADRGCLVGLCDYGAFWLVDLSEGRAGATFRNGSGTNPPCFATLTEPVLGTNWTTTVDASIRPSATQTFLVAYECALGGLPTAFGEVLVDPTSALYAQSFVPPVAGSATHALALPDDVALLGLTVATQAGLLGGGPALCNAFDLVLGL